MRAPACEGAQQRVWLTFLLMSVLCTACAQDLNVTTKMPEIKRGSGDVIERLAGNWMVHTYVSSDCYSPHQFSFPSGQSVWTDTGETLSIESLTDAHPAIELFAVNRDVLERHTHVETADCMAIESWTLRVIQDSDTHATGRFEAAILLKGEGCEAIRPHFTALQTCLTTTDWRAVRLGPVQQ